MYKRVTQKQRAHGSTGAKEGQWAHKGKPHVFGVYLTEVFGASLRLVVQALDPIISVLSSIWHFWVFSMPVKGYPGKH